MLRNRTFHATLAALIVLLILSGFLLHFGVVPGDDGVYIAMVRLHEWGGLLGAALWLWFLLHLLLRRGWRRYLPPRRGFWRRAAGQLAAYMNSTAVDADSAELNVLRQVTYSLLLFVLLPLLVLSGLLMLGRLWFPGSVLGVLWLRSGGWPVAVLHFAAAIPLAAFVLIHVYMVLLTRGSPRR